MWKVKMMLDILKFELLYEEMTNLLNYISDLEKMIQEDYKNNVIVSEELANQLTGVKYIKNYITERKDLYSLQLGALNAEKERRSRAAGTASKGTEEDNPQTD